MTQQQPRSTEIIASTRPDFRRIQRVKLEAFDDVISVRDRLQQVDAGRVLLVFPKEAKILQRKLDLVLIQRECARRNLRLAIVTVDPSVAVHAKELNISAFANVEQARTSRWKRPANKVFVDRRDRPKSSPMHYELMDVASRLRPPAALWQRRLGILARGILFGVAILMVFLGLYAVVPSATVTVTPAQDQLDIPIRLLADPSIDAPIPEGLRVPARSQTFLQEANVTIETTGVRRIEDTLAEGTVIFTNETTLQTLIVAGTIVRTEGTFNRAPAEFETLQNITLEAQRGATAEVTVRALANPSSAGVAGNVEAEAITTVVGPLTGSVSVTNPQAITGGGIRETAFVTANDHERLRTLARTQALQNARSFLISTIDEENTLLVTDSIRIVEERSLFYSEDINEPADTVSLTMLVTIEATLINLNEARLVAFANLGGYVPDGRTIDEDTIVYRRGDVQQILSDRSVVFQMQVEGETQVKLDAGQIRDQLAGLSEDEARAYLENEYLLDPRYPPEIDTFPPFLNRMPMLPIRIQVEVAE